MQSPTITISLLFYCTILVCLNHQSDGRDTITTNNPLRDDTGESLVSAGGRFELGFFTPPKGKNRCVGIRYHNLSRRVVWVANRDKYNPVSGSSGSFAIAEDGNLKVFLNGNACAPIPITDLKNVSVNRTVKLLDNGNLIVFDGPSPSVKLWQSFDHPTDTFLPGMEMDDNMVLTSEDYTFRKYQGFYKIQKGSNIHWRSGEPDISVIPSRMPNYVANLLSGSKETLVESEYQSSVTQNDSQISYNFTCLSRNKVSHLFMNSTGKIQYYEWDDMKGWTLQWSEPQDDCSVYNHCGEFSICNSSNPQTCQCLPRFQPVLKEDSSSGDCERMMPIRCDNTADKMKQSKFLNLSLTDFSGTFEPFDKAQNEENARRSA